MKKKSLFIVLLIALLFLLPFALTGCSPLDKRYTVTFDTDGGTVIESQKVDYGQKAIEPEQIPTKDGYEFDGWYYGEDEWIFLGYVITENTTLKAKWKPIEYQITYNAGSAATMPTYGVTTKYTIESDNITLPVPTIEWYEFLGWYDNSQREGEPIFELTTGHFGNLNLYAKYQYVGLEFTESYGSYQVSSVDPRLGDEGWVLPNASQGELIIPDTYKGEKVTSIKSSTFKNNTKITSVTIGKNVTSIGSDAFDSCASLTKVNYTGTIDTWAQMTFSTSFSNPLRYAKNLYINNELVTNANITTATKISSYAFLGCTSLTSVTIGDSVTSIGSYAFYNTSYYNNTSNWENEVLYIGKYLIGAKTTIEECEIKEGTLAIADNAFVVCYNLTSVTIGDSVTSIGEYAFESCRSLTSVTIGNSVTSIGEYAFYNCSSLTSIEIPDSVTSIGDGVFDLCTSLTSVEIPDSVTSIGNSAFSQCYSLTSIEIPDSVTSIGGNAFYYCSNLTSIEIPDSVTSIGDRAFYNCTSLTSINFNGTKAQWNAISKGSYWNYSVPATYVTCSDGTVSI